MTLLNLWQCYVAWQALSFGMSGAQHGFKHHATATAELNSVHTVHVITSIHKVVKSSWLPAKISAFLVRISWPLCLAFLYGWHFLNKILLEWPLTLTTQLSTSKLSDNPVYTSFLC